MCYRPINIEEMRKMLPIKACTSPGQQFFSLKKMVINEGDAFKNEGSFLTMDEAIKKQDEFVKKQKEKEKLYREHSEDLT